MTRTASTMAAAALAILALLAVVTAAPGTSVAAPPPAAGTAPSKPAPAQPTDTPAPASIPAPEVAGQAEEAGKLLRQLDELLVPSPAVETIQKRLPDISARIGTETESAIRQLDYAVAATLDGLINEWQATRTDLVSYIGVLAGRGTALEAALERLTTMRELWTRTRADALVSKAPTPVVQRIDGVLAAVAASNTRLQEQRAATLVLQDRVAREVARCDAILGRIAAARQDVSAGLFERDSVPVWDAERLARERVSLPTRVRDVVTLHRVQLRQFAQDQRGRIVLQVALFAGLALLIRAARRKVVAAASPGARVVASLRVFDRPASAAVVLALLASPWIYGPSPPRAAATLMAILALAFAVRVMRLLLDPPLVRGLYLLGAFFLVDLIRRFASVVPVLEQQVFLLEMLAGIVVLSWRLVSRRRAARTAGVTPRERALQIGELLVLLAFVGAFAAAAAGYMKLALLLGAGVLGSGYLALVLYAGVRVGDGLVAFALRARPLRHLGMVERHRPLIERRGHTLLRWLAIGVWVIFALRYFGLWSAAAVVAQAVLGAELRRGSLSISLADVLVFALTVWAAFLLSALLRFTLEEEVYPRLHLTRGLPSFLSSLVHYALLLAGFLLALAALGVDLTKITILAGAFGVGIGFGLQNVVNNLVSGLLVIFERRIDVGDAVQIGDVAGRVEQIGMRACTVRTWEGAEVIVPNASLISNNVTNWTLSDRRRRVDVAVSVAHDAPPDKMLAILLAVARAHPLVLADPAPAAFFLGFGDSALRFEVRAWTDSFDLWVQTQSEMTLALHGALREAGIEIAFPRREVRLRQE